MNVSITALVEDLNTTIDGIQGATALNALLMAVFVLMGGKMGDVLGMKRSFLVGVLLTIAGSFVASIANDLAVFILGWCLIQGLGAAFMMPNIQSLIRTNVAGDARAKSYGTLGGVNALGAAVGPIIGGFLTAYLSWRWAFRVEILALVVVLFLSGAIPKDKREGERPSLDWIGVILQAVGLILIVVGILVADTHGFLIASQPMMIGSINLTPFGLSPTVLFIGAGITFLFLFAGWQQRRERLGQTVLLHLEMFKNLDFSNALFVRTLVIMVNVGLLFVFPLFLQVTFGLDALETGLLVLPLSVTLIIMVPVGVRLAQKFPPRSIIRTGWLIAAFGAIIIMVMLQLSEEPKHLIPGVVTYAIGIAMPVSQVANFVMSTVKAEDAPEASGVMSTFEQVGNSFGVAILSAILAIALTQGTLSLVKQRQVLPPELRTEIVTNIEATNQVEIVDNITVYQAAQAEEYSEDVNKEIVTIYHTARENAFQITTLMVSFICVIGFFLSGNLPKKSLAELTSVEG
jgi:MFS family permease